jgi:hypothetical protein
MVLQLNPKYPQLSKKFTDFLFQNKICGNRRLNIVIPQLDEQQKSNNNNEQTKTAAAAAAAITRRRRRRRRRAQNNRKLCVFESVLRSILQPPIHENGI